LLLHANVAAFLTGTLFIEWTSNRKTKGNGKARDQLPLCFDRAIALCAIAFFRYFFSGVKLPFLTQKSNIRE
jgi:hypothetical protein